MKESLKKIEELKNQLNAVKSELQNEFKAELKKIFVDNPTLDSIEMYLNNHEFNDGGDTSFYIGYEDLKIVVEGEEVEREWDNATKQYKPNPVLESLIELFGAGMNHKHHSDSVYIYSSKTGYIGLAEGLNFNK